MKNLKNLDKIALRNNGNRAFGFPGYTESVEFITSKLAKASRTSTSWIQDFPALFASVTSISLKVDGVSYFVFGLTYSPSTTAEGINGQFVLGPTGPEGCTVDGYANFDVKDKIVLVERGTCPTGGTLAGRIRPAKAAGAIAVIIFNSVNSHVTGGGLSAPDPEGFVPSGFIDRVDGLVLRDRLAAGETLEATFQQTQIIETKITQNVIAETKGGDPNNVIMVCFRSSLKFSIYTDKTFQLGAHLDSIQAGPGINDDGQ